MQDGALVFCFTVQRAYDPARFPVYEFLLDINRDAEMRTPEFVVRTLQRGSEMKLVFENLRLHDGGLISRRCRLVALYLTAEVAKKAQSTQRMKDSWNPNNSVFLSAPLATPLRSLRLDFQTSDVTFLNRVLRL